MAENEKLVIYFDNKGLQRLEKAINGNKAFSNDIKALRKSLSSLTKRIERLANMISGSSIGKVRTYISPMAGNIGGPTIIPISSNIVKESITKAPKKIRTKIDKVSNFVNKYYDYIGKSVDYTNKAFSSKKLEEKIKYDRLSSKYLHKAKLMEKVVKKINKSYGPLVKTHYFFKHFREFKSLKDIKDFISIKPETLSEISFLRNDLREEIKDSFSKVDKIVNRSKRAIGNFASSIKKFGRFFINNITQLSGSIAGAYWSFKKIYDSGIKEITDLKNILAYGKLKNIKVSHSELKEILNRLELTNVGREKGLRYIQAMMTAGIPKNKWESFIYTTHALGKIMGRSPDMVFNQLLRFLQGGTFPSMYLNTIGLTKEKFYKDLAMRANLFGKKIDLKEINKKGIPEKFRGEALDLLLRDIHEKIPEKYFTELGSADVWSNIQTRLKQSILVPFSEGFVYGIQPKLEKIFGKINDQYGENVGKYKYFGELIGKLVGEILINVKKGADALAKIAEYFGTKYAEANMNIEDYFTKHPLAREAVNFAQGGLELSIINYLKYSDTNLFPIASYVEKKWD